MSPRRTASRLAALLLGASLLACSGAMDAPVEDLPAWAAEPFALVDLPGEENPTDLVLLPGGAFAAAYRLLGEGPDGRTQGSGGVRFRAADGGQGPRADLGPDVNLEADGMALSPDGATLAVARYDRVDLVPLDGGEVRALSLADRADEGPASLLGACSAPWRMVWGGRTIVARCAVGPPFVAIDADTGARAFEAARQGAQGEEGARDLAVSADGATLAVLGTSDDYAAPTRYWVELRALPDGAAIRRLPLTTPFEDLAFSPDGARIAVSHPYYGVRILDATTGSVLGEHTYPEDPGNRGSGDVLWSADGAVLYRAGRRGSVTVHDGADARVLGYFPAHADEPPDPMSPPPDWPPTLASGAGTLAVAPDGRLLAAIERSDLGRAVRIWRLPASAPVASEE